MKKPLQMKRKQSASVVAFDILEARRSGKFKTDAAILEHAAACNLGASLAEFRLATNQLGFDPTKAERAFARTRRGKTFDTNGRHL